jgi:hypothetical protein
MVEELTKDQVSLQVEIRNIVRNLETFLVTAVSGLLEESYSNDDEQR